MMDYPKILLVDDDEEFLDTLIQLAEDQEYEFISLTDPQKVYDVLRETHIDLIITDVEMPGLDGMELFRRVNVEYPHIPVIFVTAFPSTDKAVKAIKEGAYYYFEKPLFKSLELFWKTIREAIEFHRLQRKVNGLEYVERRQRDLKHLVIGTSPKMQKVYEDIKRVANLNVPVLITGETGTGKEMVAREIHYHSKYKDNPFIAVNCCELSDSLLESELFGHEKGAFTGAHTERKGLFELANGTTLFLDEIGITSVTFQAKLLRVLQDNTFKRVGGNHLIRSDFRLITATNIDLKKAQKKGEFRSDLYYRINVFPIHLPPLRDRKEDIFPLAMHFIKKYSRRFNKKIEGISPDALVAMSAYEWPGNVRELENLIERAVITCDKTEITLSHLPFGTSNIYYKYPESELSLKSAERMFIQMALYRTKGNKTQAAQLLGIARQTLLRKMREHGINLNMPES